MLSIATPGRHIVCINKGLSSRLLLSMIIYWNKLKYVNYSVSSSAGWATRHRNFRLGISLLNDGAQTRLLFEPISYQRSSCLIGKLRYNELQIIGNGKFLQSRNELFPLFHTIVKTIFFVHDPLHRENQREHPVIAAVQKVWEKPLFHLGFYTQGPERPLAVAGNE